MKAKQKEFEKEITIIIDVGEARNKVTRFLASLGIKIRKEKLEIGDYQLSNRIIIERKTTIDFLQSIIDKRLFNQVIRMKEYFKKPVLIIEGKDLYAKRKIHPNAVRGAVSSMIVFYGISVLFTENEEDTAKIIAMMAKQEQVGLEDISLRKKIKALTMADKQEYVVQSLPNVGPVISKSLLNNFKTIEKIMTAAKEELMMIDIIGEKRAEEIRKVLTAEYEGKNNI